MAVVILACAASARPAFAQSADETIRQTLPKVVKIYGAGGLRGLAAYSTGFIVSPEGHIATVWSHVLDRDEVTVVLNDGRRYEAKVLGAEPQLDLGMLKIKEEGLDLPYFDVSQAADAAPGTRVLAFSNMFKVAVGDEPVSVLHGVIAAKWDLSARRGRFRVPYQGPVYVVDAITNNPGAAGGVLTTRDGKLVGVIGKELRNSESNTWINYAIPIEQIKEPIAQIVESGIYVERKKPEEDNPRRYAALDFGLVMVPDVLYRTPAYVDSVLSGSPAAEAGLKPDDLVLFVNEELMQSVRMLNDELGYLEAGDTLRLIVQRGSGLVTVELAVERKGE
ncbi:MAG TPA: S1C family serine protease [Planctomycetaceae bacterium]|nr:S1C family serine protease [Planctomycetaceae bacterium]